MRTLLTIAIFLLVYSNTSYAKELNYNNMFLTSLKLGEKNDYGYFIESYMKVFQRDIWQEYHNDEFSLENKKNEAIEHLKNQVERFDLSEPFVITVPTIFRKYDFQENEFSYVPLPEGTYFPVESTHLWLLKLKFNNADIIENISMEETEAQEFLEARKNSNGSINRNLDLTIKVIPESIDGNNIYSDIIEYKISDSRGNIIFEKTATD